ncbi:MAG TPA: methylated-DNA--[protein]-cysteine S-methyltransferase [Acidimicrobiales bacterium]|jgi:methylated-DNA-[protein]-cysteine S-methyltransferase
MERFVINVDTPLGPWGVEGDERVVTAIYQPHERHRDSPGAAPNAVVRAATQLEEYFDGRRKKFRVTLGEVPATPFQRDVWAALVEIPYGEVRTYGEIAQRVERPRASRAVGNANHVNPYPILVPCHRVVGSTNIGGYGGGGERMKRFLLELEGVDL